MNKTIDEIWYGDLLGRKEEAELLIAYIECLSGQRQFREDAKACTIAVDAGYGEGKTWFLKRLAEQLALNHPVAFVDAWQDDLADEPLTALMATLKKALSAHFPKHKNLRSKFDVAIEKSGRIAKISAIGFLKRGLGLLLTTGAVDAAEGVLNSANDAMADAVYDGLKDGAQELADGVFGGLQNASPAKVMTKRIADFEEGQTAILELKASLESLVDSLDGNEVNPPIVIIIDELDRCRPSYAIKLLEEVKHLFDVPGLVFVLGMHGEQLNHSVSAAYGQSFNGAAYLSRFIGKRYSLNRPVQRALIEHISLKLSLDSDRLISPQMKDRSSTVGVGLSRIISLYTDAFELGPRDTIRLIEALHVCLGLTGKHGLFLPLLLPLLIQKLKSGENPVFRIEQIQGDISAFSVKPENGNQWQDMNIKKVFEESAVFVSLSTADFDQEMNRSDNHAISGWLLHMISSYQIRRPDLAHPLNYGKLVEAVGRFSNPQSDDEA